jgi:proteasome assembly chaperone (PAC2) family protein
VPSAAHVVFIPGVLLIGMVIGYVMGARAARAEIQKRKARAKE